MSDSSLIDGAYNLLMIDIMYYAYNCYVDPTTGYNNKENTQTTKVLYVCIITGHKTNIIKSYIVWEQKPLGAKTLRAAINFRQKIIKNYM